MKKLFKFSILPLLVILLTFIQVSAEEDILLELSVGEGDLLMYFVDGDNEYISEPSAITFETSNTSFDPIEVEGTFGVSSQKLRIDNATGSEVELSVALDVSDFAEDAKWLDGEKSFLAYSTDGSTGGLLVDPENIVLTDDDCGGVSNDRTSSRFTYIDSETNVMSIDVLNTSGGSECRFDLTNLLLTQTIPPRTSSGNYSLGMVLTLTSGDWWVPIPEYTLSYTAGEGGSISGESTQTVSHGSDGSSVEAVADEGYEFLNWSDEVTDNPRTDTNVTGDISVTANFVEVEDCSTMDIGDECGGGIVVYLYGTGEGLIAAAEDQSTGSDIEWGCKGIFVGASGTDIGTGVYNTAAILSGCLARPIAASVCDDYGGEGYDDWFLPSSNELNKFDEASEFLGFGEAEPIYWSSSEYSDERAWNRYIGMGAGANHKDGEWKVRCARAF
jgi:hypothetical protein